jgi:FAD/FMN-containing dehydrogenase
MNFYDTFSGDLVMPGDPRYDEARKVFNGMIDRRPLLIARCATTADVSAAVLFARQSGSLVAVRCGGHSVAGHGVCDGGIVIDLGGLKAVDVDPVTKTARVGGGVLWGEFDAAAQGYGLHTPGGRVTTTGVGGFTLGGGYGWTSSKHGLACDNLVSAEVVLADGSVVRASEHENADLFWGIRGGGGNFGIVTEFEFRLHALGPTVLAGLALFPFERARAVMRGWRDFADAAPYEVSTACVVLTAPPEEFVPESMRGRTALGIAVLYAGDPADGASLVQPLRDLRPAVDHIGPMPYTVFQGVTDPAAPPGFRNYWRGEYLRALADDAIDVFLDQGRMLTEAARPLAQMVVFRIGQGVADVPEDATAFSQRRSEYLFHPIVVWSDPADDAPLIAAARSFAEQMRSFGVGASYLNFEPEPDRVRDAFGADTYQRLVALKNLYDPDNLFRLNQNIAPSRERKAASAAAS